MPMPTRSKFERFQQLHLFRSRPATPRWQNLSTEIQRKTLTLLARMIRASVHARLSAERGMEASDE
jgi:hypothetical protein